MCGIAGYVGERNAPEVLFDMLKRLEYRGYDSAGIMFLSDKKIGVIKDKGTVDEVRAHVKPEEKKADIGVAHTRWATHGIPSMVNAHPHHDCTKKFAVAHNGIIENYRKLKDELKKKGHTFKSETDTEVVSHLIEENFRGNLLEAFEKTLSRLEGSYALAVLYVGQPDVILVARKESPLLIGLGEKENFIASDAPAFVEYTRKAWVLDDFEYGEVRKNSVHVYSLRTKKRVRRKHMEIIWDVEEAEKQGYHHFMLKEIMEEPDAARNALKDRGNLEKIARKLSKKQRIYLVACGTAYHACLYGKYLLEHFGIQAESHVASEFRYSTVETLDEYSGVLFVSQSGETADTIAAAKGVKKKGAYAASIVNVVGSTLTRVCDDTAYTYSGPEIAVASTKAYVGQLVSVALLSFLLAKIKNKLDDREFTKLGGGLSRMPDKIREVLGNNNIRELSEAYGDRKTFFYIARNINLPTALEGALKLKEITYVHAEGYAAGELKHGPLAVLDEKTVVIAVHSGKLLRGKIDSNIMEARSRNASVVVLDANGDIAIPKTHDLLTPILNIVPLHLFAYYMSVLRGLDPDKPRNLAKSVTVE